MQILLCRGRTLKYLLARIVSLCAAHSVALPQYQGSTFGEELTQQSALSTGNYIWNNQSSPLASSILLDDTPSLAASTTESADIYIGSGFNAPEVLSVNGMQAFQVSVPGPYGIGLVLCGLLGLKAIALRQNA